MAETNVSVRFSVQDAETVRQALQQLGTDGQKALDKLNAGGQAPSTGLKAVSSVVDELKNRATGLAFSLGPIGTGLVALGPVGLAAAAALGLIAAAIGHAIDEANRLGEVSKSLRNLSETTGLTGAALQGLVNAGGQLGIESEKVESSLSHFTSQLDQVHQAGGTLYDQILKVNPAIADQMVKTRDAAAEWNLLARAYAAADTAQRAAIARAAFGRGGIGTGRLLEATAVAGGLDALAGQNTNVLTDQQIKQFAELKSKIDEINKTAKDLMASIWTEDVLRRGLQAAEQFERIAKAAKDLHDQQSGMGWWERFFDNIGNAYSEYSAASTGHDVPKITVRPAGPGYNETYGSPAADKWMRDKPAPADAAADKETALARLNVLRQQMAILGPAANSTQELALRQAELNAAVEKAGGRYGDLAAKAKQYYEVQRDGADLQIKVTNNVATADELRTQHGRELQLLVQQGRLTQDQATQSLQAYEKVVEQTIEQEKVRAAALPGLMQLQNQAGSLRTQLDTFGTETSKYVGDAFVSMATGASTAGAAFRNLEAQVLKSLANMLVQMAIVKPIAQGLQSALGGFLPGGSAIGGGNQGEAVWVPPVGSAKGNVFGFANGGAFTNGIFSGPTPFRFGSGGAFPGVMGEAGPEAVMPLTRMPGGKLGVAASPSIVGPGAQQPFAFNFNPQFNIDIQNPDGGKATTTQKRNASGGVDLQVVFRKSNKSDIANGVYDKELGARYGLAPSGAVR